MLNPFEMPSCMLLSHKPAVHTDPHTRRSPVRYSTLLRRAALALAIPAALFVGSAVPVAQPVAVETAPASASINVAGRSAVEGSLALGAPRVNSPSVGTVTAYSLNVRSGPGTGYRVVTTVSRGTQGTVLGQASGWYNIRLATGTTGWVSGTYFSLSAAPQVSASAPAPGANVASIARRYVGSPYVFGAAGPNAFDCSGFTQFVFRQVGISIARTTETQYNTAGTRIRSYSELQPGDLIFFANTYKPGISHVGIYAGNGEMIHAANARTGVTVASIHSSYYSSRFAGAIRPYR